MHVQDICTQVAASQSHAPIANFIPVAYDPVPLSRTSSGMAVAVVKMYIGVDEKLHANYSTPSISDAAEVEQNKNLKSREWRTSPGKFTAS